jgi:hypothetical protein
MFSTDAHYHLAMHHAYSAELRADAERQRLARSVLPQPRSTRTRRLLWRGRRPALTG